MPTLLVAALASWGIAASTVLASPSTSGAAGTTGLHEKQLSLTVATAVADRLRTRGIAVELTRTTDRTLTLRQRVALADRVAPTCSSRSTPTPRRPGPS